MRKKSLYSVGFRGGNSHPSRLEWVVRAFWLVMFVGHAPAWLDSFLRLLSDPTTQAVRFPILSVSIVYFALKVCGFRFIHVHPSWKSTVTFCLIVALLHIGIIPVELTPSLAGLIGTIGLVCLVPDRFIGQILSRFQRAVYRFLSASHLIRPSLHRYDWFEISPPPLQWVYSLHTVRGPPVPIS